MLRKKLRYFKPSCLTSPNRTGSSSSSSSSSSSNNGNGDDVVMVMSNCIYIIINSQALIANHSCNNRHNSTLFSISPPDNFNTIFKYNLTLKLTSNRSYNYSNLCYWDGYWLLRYCYLAINLESVSDELSTKSHPWSRCVVDQELNCTNRRSTNNLGPPTTPRGLILHRSHRHHRYVCARSLSSTPIRLSGSSCGTCHYFNELKVSNVCVRLVYKESSRIE